jgi:hypothetical protein
VHTGFWWGHLREGPIVAGRIILRWIFMVGMDWIDKAQDRDRWQALIRAVMNLRFP